MKVLAATNNKGKLAEIRRILRVYPVEILSPTEIGLDLDVAEDGATFEENAIAKALAFCHASGLPSLADDSGLCVDALAGRPGVRSARFAGDGASDRDNYELLLKLLEGVKDRTAHFMCVVALALDGDTVITASGRCDGVILHAPRGDGGFGYDPVFLEPGLGKTFAELDEDEKNALSHRGKALAALGQRLREMGIF